MEENIIQSFHEKLTYETINNNFIYENELKRSYRDILIIMASDYSEYQRHVAKFLSSLEVNNTHSVSYSISLFFELYKKLVATTKFKSFDLSVIEYVANDATLDKMKIIFEDSYSKNNQQRMSEDNFDISSLSSNDKNEMASLIIDRIQVDGKQLNWNKDMVELTMMNLIFLRQILNSLNNSELFYVVIGIFFDRLSSSEYYQAGRDIAEEVIISSYKDNVPELGYFNAFRIYSNVGSVHASLLYANLSMTCTLQKQQPYSEKYIKEIIWQGIKFFRNVNLFPWVSNIYNSIPTSLNFLGHEKRSLDHSFFLSMLSIKEPSLPVKLLDYLNKEREEIISGDINEALPWLLTIYNVRRLYSDADFSATGFGFFVNVLEVIVPVDTVRKYKDIIEADSPELKKYLKESLVKLNETRDRNDFLYDNESAIKISSRLIEYSINKQDASAFLLSMILKSDYSILFQGKKSPELAPLILPDVNIDTLEILYEDTDAFLELLPVGSNISINWLASSEENLYQLQLFNKAYSFFTLNNWSYEIFKDLMNNDYFVNLRFSDSIKDKSGVRLVSPEEFKHEEETIAKKLDIARLSVIDEAAEIYIIKDMQISKLPHNLFLNKNGEFIAKNIPITNVLSTEWLLQTNNSHSLPDDYSKSIWIPVESGDFALNYLFSNIEQTLNEHSFDVFKDIELTKPLSSDINIICSHGAKNISEVQVIFQENNPTYDLNTVIADGKILIFFVCYSGSMKTEFFRNNVASIVKRFIAQGYEAVIAPFWALDVTIPHYWLPEFLSSINSGNTVSQSVFNANRKVYEKYPTPAAWACLHLYGNPNLKKAK